ncbi:AfsR/SARP family transcriptional regulator [Streptomyces sp. NPDC048269]|uniref:AfsR/SARP family transcriptional regulator n=1 Tax=Streptomyces sp. NPDC048269 TaxID=3155753 RepID=UPI00342C9C86
MLQFNVLGPLAIKRDGREIAVPRGPKVRQLLSLLILHPGAVVSHESLIDELWSKEPPKTALSTLRTHVYHLRKILREESGGAALPGLLHTWPAGYVLRAAPEQVDAEAFRRCAREGEALLNTGELEEGARALARALDLWSGGVLTDVMCGPVLTQYVQHLEEVHMRVLQQRIGAEMQLGHHGHLAAELKSLVTRHPLNEWLHGQLITALYRSGRRGDALQAYQTLRGILQEELGLDPSRALQHMQRVILSGADGETLAMIQNGTQRSPSTISRLPQAC